MNNSIPRLRIITLQITNCHLRVQKSIFENNSSRSKPFSNSFVLNDFREAEFVNETFRYENSSPDSRLHISIKPKTSQIDGGNTLKLNMHEHMQINEDWNGNYLELPNSFLPLFFSSSNFFRTEEMKGKAFIFPLRVK